MNKLQELASFSKVCWVMATVLMSFNWLKMTTLVFRNVHYVIEDNFIYIGVLGGWLFIQVFYISLIIFTGWYIIRLIDKMYASVALSETGDKDGKD